MAGHIRKRGKRKDGTWRWQARYPDPARLGTTAQIERTFRTRQEAEDWLTEQAHALRSGSYVSPKQAERPFSDVLAAWRESWPNLSPTTADRYANIVKNYLRPTFGGQPIGRITHEVVQRYVNGLAAEHAPGTVRNVYACLRNACSRGVRLGMLKVNPCTKIDLPSSPREEMLFLSAEEVRAVAEAIDPYYRVLVYTAAYTGLRAGELLALERRDVDLKRSTLSVRRARREVSGTITTGPTKTAGSRRTVSLPVFLRDMLAGHLADTQRVPFVPDALVFASKTGKPLRHNLFYRRHFKAAVRRALPPYLHGLRWHDLRHTCASLSIAAGAHPKLISARLGHSSVNITLDRYGHLFPSVEEALAEALDATFADSANSAEAARSAVTDLQTQGRSES